MRVGARTQCGLRTLSRKDPVAQVPISALGRDAAAAWRVRGGDRVDGTLRPPGDKSIGHRAVLLAALGRGTSILHGLPDGEDVARTRTALGQMGVEFEAGGGVWTVHGHGLRGLHAPAQALDCGNSGTTMRLLCGVLAAQPFPVRLTGDASLSRRPMRRVADPLSAMGARIECAGEAQRPPVQIRPATLPLAGTTHRLAVDSAQVRSALLLAGLYAGGPTRIEPAAASRDHTERMLRACGVVVREDPGGVTLLPTRNGWDGFEARIPGDVSSAVFWIVAAGTAPGARLRVDGVGLNPGRARVLEILHAAGLHVTVQVTGEERGEPWGRVEVRGTGALGPMELHGADVVRCIDEIPALAAAACLAGVELRVRDAAELRTKESDRIAAILRLARAFGARGHEAPDGFRLDPGTVLRPGAFDAAGDHRLAMAAALLGFRAPGESRIGGVQGVATSYPGFLADALRLLRPSGAPR